MDRILLVDDEPAVLRALSRVFSPKYEVVTADGGVRGVQAVETSAPFQVVVSDYRMPEMNGAQFLERVRALDPRPARVLLTAATDPDVAAEAINRGGIHRLLGKPCDSATLLAVASQACESYHLARRNEELDRELRSHAEELERMNRTLESLVEERTASLLEGLTCALDYRDTETQWHSRRVALYSHRIAASLGIDGIDLLDVDRGALLHDIGKIGVRDAILLKPGPLDPQEWEEMRRHAELGFRILRNIGYLSGARVIVLQHQEKWDGSGYPQRLKGRDIVVGARVFSVADTLDAITSDRPYRKAKPLEAAVDEIVRCAGTQFDPDVVNAFRSIPRGDFDDIRGAVDRLAQQDQRAREAEATRIAAGKLTAA